MTQINYQLDVNLIVENERNRLNLWIKQEGN
jgi:hypothetical protein